MLALLGKFAADSEEYDLATSLWRAALQSNANLTSSVIANAARYKSIESATVLPDDAEVYHQAGKFLVDKPNPKSTLDTQTLDQLCCESCDSKKDAPACLRLSKELEFMLGQYKLAFESYQSEISLVPIDPNPHQHYIVRLRMKGDQKAKRVARDLFSEDPRFDLIIQELATEDRNVAD